MAQRVHYQTRKSYNTKSNKQRIVRTPGGKLVSHRRKKLASGPICADTKVPLQGIPHLRPHEYAGIAKSKRTVARAYGGCLSHSALRNRIMRAFLIEEQKAVKEALRQTRAAKKEAKVATKKAAKVTKKAQPEKATKKTEKAAKKAAPKKSKN